jgi:hypothetical protein
LAALRAQLLARVATNQTHCVLSLEWPPTWDSASRCTQVDPFSRPLSKRITHDHSSNSSTDHLTPLVHLVTHWEGGFFRNGSMAQTTKPQPETAKRCEEYLTCFIIFIMFLPISIHCNSSRICWFAGLIKSVGLCAAFQVSCRSLF